MPKAATAALVLGALARSAGAVRMTDDEHELNATRQELDWSEKGMVTDAPDQGGHCNSCYIWASLGCIESRWAIKTGMASPRRLSAQQALDCMWTDHMQELKSAGRSWIKPFGYRGGFNGCNKGEPKPVLQYLIDEGFMFEEDYPVQYSKDGDDSSAKRDKSFIDSRKSQCQVQGREDKLAVRPSKEEAKVRTFSGNTGSFEEKAMKALESGPVAIGISDTSHGTLQRSKVVSAGGVAEKDCPNKDQTHAVLLVGYGEMDGQPYWKIRNSWGEFMFDKGYFKIPRGKNFCGAETLGAFIEFQ